MNIFVSVGEVSGDIHAANLIHRFKKSFTDARFLGMGGDLMAAAGQEQDFHIREMAILGLAEVIKHLPHIRRVFKKFEKRFAKGDIDAVILVDYPGFNLRLAKIAKKYNIPVFYYICPQMWAWGKKRIYKIKKYVDHSFVIFDFEKEFFSKFDAEATFIGHPITEALNNLNPDSKDLKSDKKVLALLPGSRKHEVESLFPVQLQTAKLLIENNPEWTYFVARAKHLDASLYRDADPEKVITDRHYDILSIADAAIVASGTATLETALFKVPYILTYKVNQLTWILGKLLVKIPFIGMVNILAGREIVPEILQKDLRPDYMAEKMLPLMKEGSDVRAGQIVGLEEIKERLSGENATEIAVNKMKEFLGWV